MTPALSLQASANDSSAKALVEDKSAADTAAATITIFGEGPSWAELLGSNNWDGLLHPLDMSLRTWILRWGDLVQVTYDSFNMDEGSKYCGSCRYTSADILSRCLYPFASDYVGSELLYATLNGEKPTESVPQAFRFSASSCPFSLQSNFQGYVAVSTDEYTRNNGGRREIYVAWRGTETAAEKLNDLKFFQTSVEPLQPPAISLHALGLPRWLPGISDEPMVMLGWYNIYTESDPNPQSPYGKLSAREQLLAKISELVEQYKDDDLSIVCTGHSLGGPIAVLSAFDIVVNGMSKKKKKASVTDDEYFPVTAVVFSCPRVGNKAFAELMDSLPSLKVLHVKNKHDIVPNVPPMYIPLVGDYVDPGVSLALDSRVSPYLNKHPGVVDLHNLQGLLHTVAGWNGGGRGRFELVVKRSVALVNKGCGYLLAKFGIPTCWWMERNKGMVYNKTTGEWALEQDEEAGKPEVPAVLQKFMALEAKAATRFAAYKATSAAMEVKAIANGGSSAADATAITPY